MQICSGIYASTYYEVKSLGTLGGYDSYASAINSSGQIAGTAQVSDGSYRAFIWDNVNGMVNITGTSPSYATSISDDGYVCGAYNSKPFRWRSSTGLQTLHNAYGDATEVIEGGAVCGHRNGANPTYWNSSIQPTLLVLCPGRNYAYPVDMESSTKLVGTAYNLSNGGTGSAINNLAVYWTSASNIGIFNRLSGGAESRVQAMNSLYQTVGWSFDSSGVTHAVIWDSFTSQPYDLGTGVANDITDDGKTIIGTSNGSQVIWVKQESGWSQAININDYLLTQGWTVTTVTGINNDGLICGQAYDGSKYSAVLLTPGAAPIPEPATVLLAGIGICGLARRFRK